MVAVATPTFANQSPNDASNRPSIQTNATTSMIASIGGFELVYSGQRFGQDGYRYTTMLRTGTETEVELPVTVDIASRKAPQFPAERIREAR